jgi:hypothetical protein
VPSSLRQLRSEPQITSHPGLLTVLARAPKPQDPDPMNPASPRPLPFATGFAAALLSAPQCTKMESRGSAASLSLWCCAAAAPTNSASGLPKPRKAFELDTSWSKYRGLRAEWGVMPAGTSPAGPPAVRMGARSPTVLADGWRRAAGLLSALLVPLLLGCELLSP